MIHYAKHSWNKLVSIGRDKESLVLEYVCSYFSMSMGKLGSPAMHIDGGEAYDYTNTLPKLENGKRTF